MEGVSQPQNASAEQSTERSPIAQQLKNITNQIENPRPGVAINWPTLQEYFRTSAQAYREVGNYAEKEGLLVVARTNYNISERHNAAANDQKVAAEVTQEFADSLLQEAKRLQVV
jgi:hypothetical protein